MPKKYELQLFTPDDDKCQVRWVSDQPFGAIGKGDLLWAPQPDFEHLGARFLKVLKVRHYVGTRKGEQCHVIELDTVAVSDEEAARME